MSVAAPEKAPAQPPTGSPPERRALPKWLLLLGVIGIWVAIWLITKGNDTLTLAGPERTDIHNWLNDRRDGLIAGRETNPVMQVTGLFADWLSGAVEWLQSLISAPDLPRPVPQIGWLGVVALAAWGAYAIATWRIALLVAVAFLSFGLLGYWAVAMDTLIITFLAVAITLVIGLPLAVLMGVNKVATTLITPVLDLLQTMPTFVYLAPLALFFGLGPSTAVVCTLLYALPPVIRIAAVGIRSVSSTTLEATDSIGQTRWQRLNKVQLPMAKRTIIVGINQSIMAALSMVTIAAFIDGPGLGKPVIEALQSLQVGRAFVAGLCIVIMAIMLDRTVTAASEQSERLVRGGGRDVAKHRITLGILGVVALALLYVSRSYFWAAEFPNDLNFGPGLAAQVDSATDRVTSTLDGATEALKDQVTYLLLNPMQDLLANSPWWLAAAAILAISSLLGGSVAAASTAICLAGIYLMDVWHNAMITLTMTLVATLLVMLLAVVFGVWMARSKRADGIIRPVLDAGQTLPPFVYLIPVLGLFGPTRFTAIMAAVVYAAPPAIKLVADGVKQVSPTTVEAATAAGSNAWQIISKVQLPMARSSLVLAANQGLLYVLSMVVIGGLVGGGALGYDVVFGFSRGEMFGKGLAAAFAIVLLGIMLDRITVRAATKSMDFNTKHTRSLLRRPVSI
ncbi:MAG: ABC transporter permease subunit [Nocardioidaceae bacterium]|nr:ABC transporter permease subunit [Nocardioidaceae bacterium]